MTDEPKAHAGYIVFQESSGPGGARFYKSREQAEDAATVLVKNNIAVLVMQAMRFTTDSIESRLS